MTKYWAACQTCPQDEPIARREIEDIGMGTFLPFYTRNFKVGGKTIVRRNPILPGYVFVHLEEGDEQWGEIQHIERAAIRVLTNAGEPSRVSAKEMNRMLQAHVMGDYNETVYRAGNGQFASTKTTPKQKKRRRRPQSVKSARARRRQLRQAARVGIPNHGDISNQVAA